MAIPNTTNLVGSPVLTSRNPAEKEGRISQPSDGSDEFARFKDLARKLVRVPKSEIDEKRRQV